MYIYNRFSTFTGPLTYVSIGYTKNELTSLFKFSYIGFLCFSSKMLKMFTGNSKMFNKIRIIVYFHHSFLLISTYFGVFVYAEAPDDVFCLVGQSMSFL